MNKNGFKAKLDEKHVQDVANMVLHKVVWQHKNTIELPDFIFTQADQ
jgi:hypothetical protein